MSSNNDKSEIDLIPVRDAAGNTLHVGDQVLVTQEFRQILGCISNFKGGGISLIDRPASPKGNQQTPHVIEITFRITVLSTPGIERIRDLFRIPNPQSEEIVSAMMEKAKDKSSLM